MRTHLAVGTATNSCHTHKHTNTHTHTHTPSHMFTHARTQHTQPNRCSRTVPHGQKSTATPTAGCAQTSALPCRSSSTTARWVSGSTATHSFSTPRTMRVLLASSLAMPLPWLSMPASCNTLMRFNVGMSRAPLMLHTRGMSVNHERWGAGVETQKMYGERLGDGVEYYLMKSTPRR